MSLFAFAVRRHCERSAATQSFHLSGDWFFKERKGAPFCGGNALLFCFVVKRI
jgi:hypothetical protein